MKVVVDTNVFISFLLGSHPHSPPSRVVLAGLRGVFTIVYGQQLIVELQRRITTKPYLATRIPGKELDLLIDGLQAEAEMVPETPGIAPSISRDRNDDFLLVDAVLANADYLVSGDNDLLELGEFEGVRIVSPAEFVEILEKES